MRMEARGLITVYDQAGSVYARYVGLEGRLRSRVERGRSDLGLPGLRDRLQGLVVAAGGRRVLDVGAGQGALVSRLSAAGVDAWGVDPFVAGGARVLRARAEALPFPRGSFDMAVSALVLHYVSDADHAMAEMRRVLAPRGRLVLADRVASENPLLYELQDRIERFRNAYVTGLRTPRQIGALLRRAGLRVSDVFDHEEALGLDEWLAGLSTAHARRLREAVEAVAPADLGGIHLDGRVVRQRIRIWLARAV